MKWLVWLLPTTSPRDDDVSVWSVPRRDRRAFFRIVGCLWLAALGVLLYKGSKEWLGGTRAWWDAVDVAVATLADFGALVIALAAVAMLLARAKSTTGDLLMSFNDWMKSRYVTPVIEAAEAKARAEGRAEARAEARAEERAKWEAWNDRRLAAEREGRTFSEPPPGG